MSTSYTAHLKYLCITLTQTRNKPLLTGKKCCLTEISSFWTTRDHTMTECCHMQLPLMIAEMRIPLPYDSIESGVITYYIICE